MMLYKITSDNGHGSAKCAVRMREDAAMLMLETFIYEACEAQGLRDRPVAHEAMAKAHCWTKRHPIEPIRIGTYTLTISAEALPE